MVTLDDKLGKQEDFLKNEYYQSFCSICIFSPGEKAYTKKGLNCHGFTFMEEDFDNSISPIYPLPRKYDECPYFNR